MKDNVLGLPGVEAERGVLKGQVLVVHKLFGLVVVKREGSGPLKSTQGALRMYIVPMFIDSSFPVIRLCCHSIFFSLSFRKLLSFPPSCLGPLHLVRGSTSDIACLSSRQ